MGDCIKSEGGGSLWHRANAAILGAYLTFVRERAQSMIPKSGNRFSEKIMLQQEL
jgi:hypothetical protein